MLGCCYREVLFRTGNPHLLLCLPEHVGHLLALPLRPQVGAQLALAQLQGTLVAAILQQLQAALLVGSLASNLLNDGAHELDALGGALQWPKEGRAVSN